MLNKDFLYRKIKLIQKDLEGLEPLGEYSFDDFFENQVVSMAVERYLERIVTRALDINRHIIAEVGKGTEDVKSYTDTFLRLGDLGVYPLAFSEELAKSAGMRNMLVHDYDNVSPRIIYDSMHDALEQYPQYCQHLLTFLEAQEE
ncbi:DUF86 domain-containing protein [Candidatus Uhrbacteria bacterium]|nr:DUF86 domain-containing protein [Candidatus Uhrbacteria bacterium]